MPENRDARKPSSKRQTGSEHSRGGEAVKAKYGPEFFREIGRKGGQTIRERGVDYLRQIGRLGGQATKERHGSEHYAEIGRKGGRNGRGSPKPGAGRTKRAAA